MNASAGHVNESSASPPPADPRGLYGQAADQLAGLITAVRPEQLDRPTPCPGFDVGGLLSHVVGGTLRVAQIGEGGGPGEVDPDAEAESGVSGVADDAWPAAFSDARTRLAAAWADDAKLDAVLTAPWGTMPGRFLLAGAVMELVTHSWDLAQALGRVGELDGELARVALRIAEQAVPAEHRGGDVPFGPPVPAPQGSGPYGELAAWLGRTWPRNGQASDGGEAA